MQLMNCQAPFILPACPAGYGFGLLMIFTNSFVSIYTGSFSYTNSNHKPILSTKEGRDLPMIQGMWECVWDDLSTWGILTRIYLAQDSHP